MKKKNLYFFVILFALISVSEAEDNVANVYLDNALLDLCKKDKCSYYVCEKKGKGCSSMQLVTIVKNDGNNEKSANASVVIGDNAIVVSDKTDSDKTPDTDASKNKIVGKKKVIYVFKQGELGYEPKTKTKTPEKSIIVKSKQKFIQEKVDENTTVTTTPSNTLEISQPVNAQPIKVFKYVLMQGELGQEMGKVKPVAPIYKFTDDEKLKILQQEQEQDKKKVKTSTDESESTTLQSQEKQDNKKTSYTFNGKVNTTNETTNTATTDSNELKENKNEINNSVSDSSPKYPKNVIIDTPKYQETKQEKPNKKNKIVNAPTLNEIIPEKVSKDKESETLEIKQAESNEHPKRIVKVIMVEQQPKMEQDKVIEEVETNKQPKNERIIKLVKFKQSEVVEQAKVENKQIKTTEQLAKQKPIEQVAVKHPTNPTLPVKIEQPSSKVDIAKSSIEAPKSVESPRQNPFSQSSNSHPNINKVTDNEQGVESIDIDNLNSKSKNSIQNPYSFDDEISLSPAIESPLSLNSDNEVQNLIISGNGIL